MKKLFFIAACFLSASFLCAQSFKTFHPTIVAESSFADQTTNIPLTTIFTPTTDGDFIVSVVLDLSPSSTANVGVTTQFVNEFGTVSLATSSTSTSNLYTGSTFSLRAKGGNPITIQSVIFVPGTALYSVHVVVQQD